MSREHVPQNHPTMMRHSCFRMHLSCAILLPPHLVKPPCSTTQALDPTVYDAVPVLSAISGITSRLHRRLYIVPLGAQWYDKQSRKHPWKGRSDAILPELLPLTTSGRYPLCATDRRQDSTCQKSRHNDTRTSHQQVGGIRALGQSSPRIPTNERKRKRAETTINPDQRLYVGRKRQRI